MTVQTLEQSQTRGQRFNIWLNGGRGISDFLHGSGHFLNTKALQELGQIPTADELYYKALAPLVGQTRRITTSLAGFSFNWTGRVNKLVQTWTKNDTQEQKEQKLTDLFLVLSEKTPQYFNGNVYLKLLKENPNQDTEELIDTTALFASSFTPAQFAQIYAFLDENTHIDDKQLMNIIAAFDYCLSNQYVEIPMKVVKDVRERFQNFKKSRLTDTDKMTKAYLGHIAVSMKYDQFTNGDLETCIDALDHPYLEESMLHAIVDRIYEFALNDYVVRSQMYQIMRKMLLTSSHSNFWQVFGKEIPSAISYSREKDKRTWKGYRKYLNILVDKLVNMYGETALIDERDNWNILNVSSGIQTFLYMGKAENSGELVPVEKSQDIVKLLLESYPRIANGDHIHFSWANHLVQVVNDLCSQTDTIGREVFKDMTLNKEARDVLKLYSPLSQWLEGTEMKEPLTHLDSLTNT